MKKPGLLAESEVRRRRHNSPCWQHLRFPLLRWVVSPLLLLALLACGGASKDVNAGGDDPCKDVDLAVEKVWSAGIKAEVMGYGGGINAEERKKIANNMDAMSEDWVRLRRSVCRDHFVRKLISVDEYKKQVRCFDDRLDQQRNLVTLLKGSNTDEATSAAKQLTATPSACR